MMEEKKVMTDVRQYSDWISELKVTGNRVL